MTRAVHLGTDEEGDPITSCVVVPAGGVEIARGYSPQPAGPGYQPAAAAWAAALMRLAAQEEGEAHRALRAAAALQGVTVEECARSWAAKGRRARDDMLRQVAREFYARADKATAARAVEREMRRYHSTAWQQHRAALQRTMAPECPPEIAGTIREAFWRQWSNHGVVIPATETIRRILAS